MTTTNDIKFHPDETVTLDDRFRGSTGSVNPDTRGIILETKDGLDNIVSASYGHTPEILPSEDLWDTVSPNSYFTTCFEGPLVKLWWDLDDQPHLSTTNNLDCKNSYWGNREERFGDLFQKYGGQSFIDNYKGSKELTHHFMILTKDLSVSSDFGIKNNKCAIVYLGSMDRNNFSFRMIERDVFENDTFFDVFIENEESLPESENFKIVYPLITKILDGRVEINEMIKRVTIGFTEESIFSPLTENEKLRGVDLRVINSYFGEPVILRTDFGITKIVPTGYYKKCDIVGNTPNIKLLIYNMMDKCRPKKDLTLEYLETFDFLFVPELSFIKGLKESKNVKVDIIKKYRELGTIGYMDAKNFKTTRCRERNLMLIALLCLPECKSRIAIEAYEEFLEGQEKLITFASSNTTKVIEGKFDDVIKNTKVLFRLKDICSRSSDYALKNSSDNPEYYKNFKFSLKGLVQNERGNSLYRINKELNKL